MYLLTGLNIVFVFEGPYYQETMCLVLYQTECVIMTPFTLQLTGLVKPQSCIKQNNYTK